MNQTDMAVFKTYNRDGYEVARALLSTFSQQGKITVLQRQDLSNKLAELQMLHSKDRSRKLRDMGFTCK